MSFLIAHRGHSARAPENTMAAFRAAADAGFGWIETDVDLLGDGTAVLIHDATLERTTDAVGPVAELIRTDLAGIDAGSWFSSAHAGQRVPQLGELIELAEVRGLNLNLELKLSDPTPRRTTRFLEAVAGQLERLTPEREVIVSSFDHELLAAFHRAAPGYATACLFEPLQMAPWSRRSVWREAVRSTGATWVHPHHRDLNRATVRMLHAEGLGVNTWTVNDRGRSRKLAAWGVRGMCTDGPERVIRQFVRIPAGRDVV